jgi:hypothetical protein
MNKTCWEWWLTTVILATLEAESKRIITVWGQPQQKVHETPISTNKKLGVVVNACHLSYARRVNKRIEIQARLGINTRPYLKNN